MRLLLDNPDFADQVIPDLARWEDWSVLDRLVAMYKQGDEKSYVRQPVVTYLTVASEQPGDVGTRAKAALAELEKLDPEGVKQAQSLMAFGFLARARDAKPVATGATRPADDGQNRVRHRGIWGRCRRRSPGKCRFQHDPRPRQLRRGDRRNRDGIRRSCKRRDGRGRRTTGDRASVRHGSRSAGRAATGPRRLQPAGGDRRTACLGFGADDRLLVDPALGSHVSSRISPCLPNPDSCSSMTTTTLDQYPDSDTDESIHYRAIHTGAIIGLVLGLASVFMLISASTTLEACLLVTPIPILGMFISLRSWSKIRRESDQYTGKWIALAGLALSALFLVTGVSYGFYVYRTEVPDGYERISFETLRPTEQQERAAMSWCRRRCRSLPASGFSSKVSSGPAPHPCELVSIVSSWSAIITSAASAICRR